ncbi:hypothetical protein [Macrococcus psychrotolerans]
MNVLGIKADVVEGAGDTFNGALVGALSEGMTMTMR